ncbi:hypothetical protein F4819DRAFT_166365 [Hypoxylon fuscum]|nr:hypothetical protein F4819DRAFT_166365 [Hypoxylon fuscum]
MPSKTEDAGDATAAGAASAPALADADRPLGEAINVATRSVHTQLNKLIILRLRLALPPQVDDAGNLLQGLLHIAPIYNTFESLWRDILDEPPVDTARKSSGSSEHKSDDSDTSEPPTACSRIHLLLFHLQLEGMARSNALCQDLATMTGWSEDVLKEQLAEISADSPVLAEFLQHIKRAVTAKPHVLLAYAWVLYMALFSGGRFIRASLERVDPSSAYWKPLAGASDDSEPEHLLAQLPPHIRMPGAWLAAQEARHLDDGDDDAAAAERHPLAFFRFATPADGEDLKAAFKARLAASTAPRGSGNLLATRERDDVVREAQAVFEFLVRVVAELDEVCGTEWETPGKPLSLRSRDSVVVEREKRSRLAETARRGAARSARVGAGEIVVEGSKGAVRFR